MKKLALLFILIPILLSAQEKYFTIEDVVLNSYYSLAPKKISQLSWIPETENYSFIKKDSIDQYLVMRRVDNEDETILLSLEKFNEITSQMSMEASKQFPHFRWINKNKLSFRRDNSYYELNLLTQYIKNVNTLTENNSNAKFSNDGKYVAYTIDNNLYLNKGGNKNSQITFETDKNIICGQAVHRNEFGINGGIFWSPKSNFIAFYRMDQTMVSDYPIVKMGTTPAKVELIKYPMAGQKSHQVTVGVYNLATGSTTYLKTGGPAEQYLTNITWGPEEKFIYIAHLNRDQNHMRLIKYDAVTGNRVKVLFEETDKEYVEPENPLIFLPNDSKKFIWNSERDGFNHLYLYNTEGKLLKQLTKGNWVVLSTDGFDAEGENLFFYSTKETPLERHYYSVNIEDNEITKISTQPGMHSIIKNDKGNLFIDSYTSSTIPRKIDIVDDDGHIEKSLLAAENPIKNYAIGKKEIFSIENKEGTKLYCDLTYPIDFDPSKKYPVIVYVYGGPHAQLVTNRWLMGRYDFWSQYMAQHGYLVFTLDNRGSANRGIEFEQAIFRHLGKVEIEDQLAGIDYLKSKQWVDSERIGVFGWSYGGFMATSLMLRTDDTYKVGVAGGAVIDWKFYEVMYGERYMDTPESNPEGYKEASLLNYVDNLHGKLLLVHGTEDPTVVIQNTFEFAEKAQHLNKPLDYFPYVGHQHGVRGRDAIHLYEKLSNYFIDNL